MSYTFYKGSSTNEILKLLLKKAIKKVNKISIISTVENIKDISTFLWNNSIPHWVEGDPFFEKNKVLLCSNYHNANILIVIDKTFDTSYQNKYEKILFIGKNNKLEGSYWSYEKNKWISQTFQQFFS